MEKAKDDYEDENFEKRNKFLTLANKNPMDAEKLFRWYLDNNYTEGVRYVLKHYDVNLAGCEERQFSFNPLDWLFHDNCCKEIKTILIENTSNDDFYKFLRRSIFFYFGGGEDYRFLLDLTSDPEKKSIIQHLVDEMLHKEKISRMRCISSTAIIVLIAASVLKSLFFVSLRGMFLLLHKRQ